MCAHITFFPWYRVLPPILLLPILNCIALTVVPGVSVARCDAWLFRSIHVFSLCCFLSFHIDVPTSPTFESYLRCRKTDIAQAQTAGVYFVFLRLVSLFQQGFLLCIPTPVVLQSLSGLERLVSISRDSCFEISAEATQTH